MEVILPADRPTDPHLAKMHDFGLALVALFELSLNDKGRIQTSWGEKSPQALGMIVERIRLDYEEPINENNS